MKVQYTLICCTVYTCLKSLLGGFDRVWWTTGLGTTPVSWLRLRWHQYGWSCSPARVVDGKLTPSLHGIVELADDWRSRVWSGLDRQHKECDEKMCIVQNTLICWPRRWRLPVYLKLLLGAFDGVLGRPGLAAMPFSWLRLRWHQYGWSCSPACDVNGALPPFLSMALWSWPSPLHNWLLLLLPGVVWRVAEQGVEQVRSPT